VNAPCKTADRRLFEIDDSRYLGLPDFKALVVDLERDFGTGLSLALYREALVCLSGGEALVVKPVSMTQDGIPIGTQQFNLCVSSTAFKVTAFQQPDNHFELQLRCLLGMTL